MNRICLSLLVIYLAYIRYIYKLCLSELVIYIVYFWYNHIIYMVYIVQFMCKQIITLYGNCGAQGINAAPSLDVMLLKPQVFSASGANQNRERTFQYAYRQHHPLLQFLPQKLAEWLANNMSQELNLPDPGDEWSSEALNNILIHCLVSNRRGDNLHTFQCVEFESDLHRGVMRARCFPFDMNEHRFYGKNVKVSLHSIHMQSICHNIPYI